VASSLAVAIATAAQSLGIELHIHVFSENQLFLETSAGILYGRHYDVALTAFNSGYDPDPGWFLGCPDGQPAPYNTSGDCDPVIEHTLSRADATYNLNSRKAAYAVIQQRIVTQVPFVILSSTVGVAITNQRLVGFAPTADGGPFWNISAWSLSHHEN
jgi:ABC-type transport system substrate-binding protein